MNEYNVVPFDPAARGGMARRGSPDKRGGAAGETLEVKCPECDAVLCLDRAVLALNPEILCAGCDATIAVGC